MWCAYADCALIEIEYRRKQTRHNRRHGDKICEVCLGATEQLITADVVFVEIHSLPWEPHELQWSQSLHNYIIEHENMVEMMCCMECAVNYG